MWPRDTKTCACGCSVQQYTLHRTDIGPQTGWAAAIRRQGYFRIYDLRSSYATRLNAAGVAGEWVTQLLRQGDAKVFKNYSQMKLQMKRGALQKLHRHANKSKLVLVHAG